MRCWMLMHGGSSYAPGTWNEDAEGFESLRDAVRTFGRRVEGHDSKWPCCDETATAAVVLGKDRPQDPTYPDRWVAVGPRGGVIVTRA